MVSYWFSYKVWNIAMETSKFYYQEKHTNEYYYDIPRCDAIHGITITFNQKIDIDKLKIELYASNFIENKIQKLNFSLVTGNSDNETKIIINDFNQTNILNIIGTNACLLKFTYDDKKVPITICNNMIIRFEFYSMSADIRIKMSKQLNIPNLSSLKNENKNNNT